MHEEIGLFAEKLKVLQSDVAKLGDLQERLSRTQAVLDRTEHRLAEAKVELGGSEEALAKIKSDAAKKHEAEMYVKQGELRDLTNMVESVKRELAVALTDLKNAQEKHEKLIKSIKTIEKAF